MSRTLERCPICGSGAVAAVHSATERMYGMGGAFEYRECARCASLALADPPDDLERYYPPGYYSFAMPQGSGADGLLPRLVRQWSTKAALSHPSVAAVAGAGMRRVGRELPGWVGLLSGLDLTVDARVLDVGCGDGHRLRTLRRHGFKDLTGSDPNLDAPLDDDGIRLTAAPVDQLQGPFDVVMFHHALEHMPDPSAVLATVSRLLPPDGAVVVRIPVAGCWAWRAYGTFWVQLDAPRHLFLPTDGGLHLLAARAGLRVARVTYDSDAFQFWGSDLYRRELPLHTEGSPPPPATLFGPTELEEFERRARGLNARADGDQAAFLLRVKAGSSR